MKGNAYGCKKKITRKLITDSFIEIISKKPIAKIAITQLCNQAQISRSTFYLHYLDIYDLYTKLETQFIEGLILTIEKSQENGVINFDNTMELYCAYIVENKVFFEIFYGDNGLKTLGNHLYNAMKKQTDRFPYKHLFYYNNNFERYASLNFFVNGSLAVINETLQENDPINIKSLAKVIIKINYQGIRPR